VDKASLLQPVPELDDTDWVPLRGGGQIRVRGLSRNEQLKAVKNEDVNQDGIPQAERAALIEARMVSAGMLDPPMSFAEVRQWQGTRGKAADVMAAAVRIQQLSGMMPDAPKSGVAGDGDDPGSGVRALSGGEAVDDGGGAAHSDER
jgi:hypothetical protein